jgi:hypothetical protein
LAEGYSTAQICLTNIVASENKPMDNEDLSRRALAAYFRSGGTTQPTGGGVVQEYEGKQYVVLSNVRGTLAVYRVRNDGMLKGLRRPPRELAPDWYDEPPSPIPHHGSP